MKNFVKYVGENIHSDIIMYNIFRFIMVNLNVIHFIVLTGLNIWFYTMMTIHCSCKDKLPHPEDTHWFFILMNVLLSIYIFVTIMYNVNRYCDDKLFMFDTAGYKRIFRDIEYTKQK